MVSEGLELSSQAGSAADDLLENYKFRRKGLVVSVVLLCFLSLLLLLKARQIDHRTRESTASAV